MSFSITIHGIQYKGRTLNSLIEERCRSSVIAGWERYLFHFLRDWFNDDPVIVVNTSGSTGVPARLCISKKAMVESARRTLEFLKPGAGNTALLCLSADYIAGKMMVVRAITGGLQLTAIKPSSDPLADCYGSFDLAAMVPLQVFTTLKRDSGTKEITRIGNLLIGGGEINREIATTMEQLSNAIYHTYGMTETVSHIALKKMNHPGKQAYFKAMKDVSFEQDESGCIVVNVPYISDNKIITRDRVRLISPTEFEFLGRLDNIINSGGIKISPEEVEQKINPYVRGSFIVGGFPDKKLGNRLVLIVERANEAGNVLRDIPEGILSDFELPREIIAIDFFDRTDSGKIIRKKAITKAIQYYQKGSRSEQG